VGPALQCLWTNSSSAVTRYRNRSPHCSRPRIVRPGLGPPLFREYVFQLDWISCSQHCGEETQVVQTPAFQQHGRKLHNTDLPNLYTSGSKERKILNRILAILRSWYHWMGYTMLLTTSCHLVIMEQCSGVQRAFPVKACYRNGSMVEDMVVLHQHMQLTHTVGP
jgi:hypothetical protein